MQTFQDSATGKYYQFDDNVILDISAGTWTCGNMKGACPTTLTPYTGPWPIPPTLGETQSAQIATLKAACQAEIIGGFAATIGGSPVTVTLSPTDQANALAASQAAQGVIAEAVPWSAGLNAPLDTIILVNGVYYVATTGGVTGTSLPTTWPTAFQQTIQDGSVKWAIFGILVGTTNGSVWATAQEIVALFKQGISFINGLRAKYNALKAQVNAATTVTAVQAIVW